MKMKFKDNYRTLIGIAVVALGTFLIYWGNKQDNDASQEKLTSQQNQIKENQKQTIVKIDSFSKKIERTKASNSTQSTKQEQLDTIQNQFDQWAKNIKGNYAEMELLREKQLISKKERQIAGNKKWSLLLTKTFENIKGMISSINKQFPKNKISFYQNNSKSYYQILQFNNIIFLRISYNEFGVKNEFPSIDIALFNNLQEAQTALRSDNSMSIDIRGENEITLNKKGIYGQFFLSPNKFYYSINELDNIFKGIITYQFMIANKELQ